MNQADKVRENRLRRAAARQGLRLSRSRRRDTRALDYGEYSLRNRAGALIAASPGLDGVEAYLLR